MNNLSIVLIRLVVITATMLITLFIVPYLKTLRDSKEIELASSAISAAVKAAEQTITGSGMGQTKKNEVLNIINEYLKAVHIEISPELLDVLIEDAVYVMNSSKK